MIDIIIELLTQVKDELLTSEDRWGTLTETQYTKLLSSRIKLANIISMMEDLDKQITATKKVIETMGGVFNG